MDSRTNDQYTELPSVETPEDVAVLYSWANLHGAKYRDFSASRREYRAQLRHRAAEQARDTDLRTQASAPVEEPFREPEPPAPVAQPELPPAAISRERRSSASWEAIASAQRATNDRIEAAHRAEAAFFIEEANQREIAEAHAAPRRRASDSERRRTADAIVPSEELPGQISDPYTPEPRFAPQPHEPDLPPAEALEIRPQRLRAERPVSSPQPSQAPAPLYAPPVQPRPEPARLVQQPAPLPQHPQAMAPNTPPKPPSSPNNPPASGPLRRPQGYRPDDASGVRQIYRGPETPARPAGGRSSSEPRRQTDTPYPAPLPPAAPAPEYPRQNPAPQRGMAPLHPESGNGSAQPSYPRDASPIARTWTPAATASPSLASPARDAFPQTAYPEVESDVAGETADPTPRRRRQDQPGYRMTDSDRAIAAYRREQGSSPDYPALTNRAPQPSSRDFSPRVPEPVVPAWFEAQQQQQQQPEPPSAPVRQPAPQFDPVPQPNSGTDTLQRSRERVAARWYALKGVFEQPGQERGEAQPPRQKETRTPVLAVFSFAGGVGKTSLVATLGRGLSSLGEKVLLTDTTSHGLLPFYFGASELREGTVRTFSPPSGSTDAPIYLVNYAVDQMAAGDDSAHEQVVEEITKSSRGAHRLLLDLTSTTGWLIRRMAHLNPTILVPLAPDMNSVISLQSIEKFLHGIDGPDGTPVQVFYLLNQFDASLPLHLDVREVLRRQLGERLLPFVIRRAPAVSEALAEGMTVIDYAADAPAAEDYLNVANWLRTVAAPATAGFRNVRWSER